MATVYVKPSIASGAPARTYGRGNTVTRCDERGTWLIALHGEHDVSTIPLLELQTSRVWPYCGIAVIDLSEVTFIDSSLIAWLLRVEHALEAAQCFTLGVVTGPPSGAAGRLFERLHMDCVLACYPTRRDAFMQAVAGADALPRPAHSPGSRRPDLAGPRAA